MNTINYQEPLNILIVEDNPSDYFLLTKYLDIIGLPSKQIFHAQRIRDAMEFLEKNNPDLIFLDLTLPDSVGISTFEKINERVPHISIIVLSGLSDTQVALNTIVLGAQDYLVKGEFDEKLLLRSIQYSMERKKNLQKVVENFERYNTLIKATNDTVWDWDMRSGDVTWDEGINEVFGYNSLEVQYSHSWRVKHIHPEDKGRVQQKMEHCLANNIDHWQEEYRFRCADNSYKVIYDRGNIIRDEKDIPYRMIGAMMDITDRKKLQEELVRNQIERQKLITEITIQTQEKERGEIGRELDDNINQILAAAKMYVDLAMHEKEPRKELLYLSYDNISKAINELRSLSKHLVPPSLGDIGLKEALAELIANLNISAECKITFRTEGSKIEQLSDNKKLIVYRIIQEQLNNILKHARATEVDIELKSTKHILRLTVADNGIGFDKNLRAKGIGLNNISNRVEMHGGTMHISSSPGEGCILRIEIPL